MLEARAQQESMKHLDALYAQFERFRFADFKKIIVGLSGGSDSLALTLAAHSYLVEHYPQCELIAVTVDHGLRAESHQEAQHVGQICKTYGIAHEIARWEDEKPKTGIQQKAREARYRLLSEAAQRHNTSLVLIAHNKGDDIETKTMRAQRHGGTAHGISDATLYDCRTWFARPFLSLEKSQLQAFLQVNAVTWVEDPSNKDRRFERVRTRQDLGEAASNAVETEADLTSEHAVAVFLADADNVSIFENGGGAIKHNAGPRDAVYHEALRVLLAMVGATAYLPSPSAVHEALSNLYQFTDNGRKFTLNGCLLTKNKDGVIIEPEQRNRGENRFGFDHILPSHNYKIASVLRERRGLSLLPPLPMR